MEEEEAKTPPIVVVCDLRPRWCDHTSNKYFVKPNGYNVVNNAVCGAKSGEYNVDGR